MEKIPRQDILHDFNSILGNLFITVYRKGAKLHPKSLQFCIKILKICQKYTKCQKEKDQTYFLVESRIFLNSQFCIQWELFLEKSHN